MRLHVRLDGIIQAHSRDKTLAGNFPDVQVFGPWEEIRVPGQNPKGEPTGRFSQATLRTLPTASLTCSR